MPNTKSKQKDLSALLVTKLSVLLDIEEQLIKALPKLAKAATDKELKDGFTTHLDETKGHVKRLERAFTLLNTKPERGMKSAGIRGIIEDGGWVIKNVKPKEALDTNLIAAASYAEHYEMAGYMAALIWAEELGLSEVAELLEANLKEEVAADEKLAKLGTEKINVKSLNME
ncbi:MAG: ferritin-like protein [Candidatus Taylorbacteria bacterium]|nr:ferritin-like protein [Candidatus Taylorbacteria bacterium]